MLAQNNILYNDVIQLIAINTNMHTACLFNTELDLCQNIDVLDVFLGKAREIEIRFSLSGKMENHVLPSERQFLSHLCASAVATTRIMIGVV
jgi:hypothetical protein